MFFFCLCTKNDAFLNFWLCKETVPYTQVKECLCTVDIKVPFDDFRLSDLFRWMFFFFFFCRAQWLFVFLEMAWSAKGDARDRSVGDKSSSSNISWAQQLCYWFAASPVYSAITRLLPCARHITYLYSSVLADQQAWYNLTYPVSGNDTLQSYSFLSNVSAGCLWCSFFCSLLKVY